MDPVISSIAENLAERMCVPTVFRRLIKNWRKQRVIVHRFIRDLKIKDLISLDVCHCVNFIPASLDPPLLTHPFSAVRDFNAGAINNNDYIMRDDSGFYIKNL